MLYPDLRDDLMDLFGEEMEQMKEEIRAATRKEVLITLVTNMLEQHVSLAQITSVTNAPEEEVRAVAANLGIAVVE